MKPERTGPERTGAERTGADIPPDAHLIVIGAMKAGTSSLYRHLTRHPRICACRTKEPEFFSEYQGHGLQVDRYGDLWDFDPDRHSYCVEGSTGYTKYPSEPHVPDRMRAAGIEPRILYIVRDPLDRIESHFNDPYLGDKRWALETIVHPHLLHVSSYYMQMQQYLLRFPDRDRYRIVDFERLVGDPQGTLRDICGWLGLEPLVEEERIHRNKTPELSRVDLLLRRSGAARFVAGLVPRAVKERAKKVLRSRLPARKRLSARERERVRELLERDVRLFGERFGFPVEKWGF